MTEQTIAQVGEFPLIDSLVAPLSMGPQVQLGPGDDGAVVTIDGSMVVSVDLLIENSHFRRDWSSAHDVGRKAIAVNVADIEAMGAQPLTVVLGFSTPADLPVRWAREFMAGMAQEAQLAGVSIVGGDTTNGEIISISVTVMGQTAGLAPVRRDGAQVGDEVAYVGRLGYAAAGLDLLMHGIGWLQPGEGAHQRGFDGSTADAAQPFQHDASRYAETLESQRHPQPPYGQGRVAARAGAHAMIDVSDGLIADLGHIAQNSGVRVNLRSEAFVIADPVRAAAERTDTDPMTWMLTGGEDHALVATFAPGTVPEGWTVIGSVDAAAGPDAAGSAPMGHPCIMVDGQQWQGAGGWTHFSS